MSIHGRHVFFHFFDVHPSFAPESEEIRFAFHNGQSVLHFEVCELDRDLSLVQNNHENIAIVQNNYERKKERKNAIKFIKFPEGKIK